MMYSNLSTFITLIVVFIGLTMAPAQGQIDSTMLKTVQELAYSTQQKYIADKRTAVFTLIETPEKKWMVETTSSEAAAYFQQQLASIAPTFPITVQVYPIGNVKDTPYGLVNLSVVNVRSAPKHAAEMATQVLLGTQLDLLKFEDGYYLVRTPEGYISWLDHYAVKPKTTQEIQQWKVQRKLIFTADYGHGFSTATTSSKRVSDLVMGNVVALLGESNGFYQFGYPDGRIAFAPKSQFMEYEKWLSPKPLDAKNILSVAEKMIGVPYLWGGTSIKGVDCSGFTKTAYFMNGVVIPRDASQQVLSGDKIDIFADNQELDQQKMLTNLQPGDLLFFASAKKTNPNARVTHVALYLGKGEFIHAAGLVRVNSLIPGSPNFDEVQYNTIVAARRYIGQVGTEGLTYVSQHTAY